MKNPVLLFLFLSTAMLAEASSVTGRVRLMGRGKTPNEPIIVYAEALDGRRVQPGKFKMTQKNKSFAPHILAVPVGSIVTFPNDDLIFHNVFSLSRPNSFDLGLYKDGQSKDRTFATPGIYRVFCNIHPQMSATILVVPTSYITEADNMGNFRFDLSPGRYRITSWSERSGDPATAEINVAGDTQTMPDLTINESVSPEAPHKNKFGQDYPKSAYDPKKN